MSDNALPDEVVPAPEEPKARQRMKPGQRREQILQTLAGMLEQPGSERITTALLAAKLEVSEAALYRHFASKAQMFEGLIDFIEHSLFSLINQIAEREGDGAHKAVRMVTVLLQFGEKNPGMTRLMVGDALVFEHERLHQRMNQLFERVESALRQVLRAAAEANKSASPTADAQVRAAALVAFAVGQLQRFARSGFKRSPLDHLEASLALMCR
jgi:TetR/AcrR family transcriptional regulator